MWPQAREDQAISLGCRFLTLCITGIVTFPAILLPGCSEDWWSKGHKAFSKCCCHDYNLTESIKTDESTLEENRIPGLLWWIRIHLPMHWTQVWFLAQDPTYRGATKPVCHSYWVWALEIERCNSWSSHASRQYEKCVHKTQLSCVLQSEKPPQWEAQAQQLESSSCLPQLKSKRWKQRTSPAKNK